MPAKKGKAPRAAATALGAASTHLEAQPAVEDYHAPNRTNRHPEPPIATPNYDWPPVAVVSKPGKVIVVRQRRFFGAMLVDLRIHIGSAAGRPTKKGISLPINFVREIGRVLADFEPQPEPPND